MVLTTRLSVLDEVFVDADVDEPPSVHVELRVGGTIDASRLEDAARAAAYRHPMARARTSAETPSRRAAWEIPSHVEAVPLRVVACANDGAVSQARSAALSCAPSLGAAGPFALTLAQRSGGDSMILSLHHAAGDGLSAYRLMLSICRAYAGLPDPVPPHDPLSVRDVHALTRPTSVPDLVNRTRRLSRVVSEARKTPPVRVATHGSDGSEPGYGFELMEFDAHDSQQVFARRAGTATINDVLLAAVAVTVRRWNDRHGYRAGRIALMMPVNVRPPEWSGEILGNYASYVTVSVPDDIQGDPGATVLAIAQRTARLKEQRSAGLLIDLLQLSRLVPPIPKRSDRRSKSTTSDEHRFRPTAVLSNLGRIPPLPHLGRDTGPVSAVWFSPPGNMPMGVSIGAVSMDERLFLTLRYRRAQFDTAAGAEFAHSLRDAVVGDPAGQSTAALVRAAKSAS
jgi:NRPS condensation-like uncharacterized protein